MNKIFSTTIDRHRRKMDPAGNTYRSIGDGTPAGEKASVMMVCGKSMRPFFRAGQMVLVREAVPETINKGSVIVFSPGDDDFRVIHRVIGIARRGDCRLFLCRGDNRSRPDDHIREDQVIGKVIGRYRNGRFKPLGRRHEYGGLVLAWMYRRLKSGVRSLVVPAWPLLSRWFTHTLTVRDRWGRDRDLVFLGRGNPRLARNVTDLAQTAAARKRC